MTIGSKMPPSESVEVEILGTSYSLRGGADPSAVRALAADLDERMRQLEVLAPGADPLKIAILSALRLADEAREARERSQRIEEYAASRIGACADRLAEILAERPASSAQVPVSAEAAARRAEGRIPERDRAGRKDRGAAGATETLP